MPLGRHRQADGPGHWDVRQLVMTNAKKYGLLLGLLIGLLCGALFYLLPPPSLLP